MLIGIDAGSRSINYCIASDTGNIVEKGREKNTGEPIEKISYILERFPGEHYVAFTGAESIKTCDILETRPVIHAVSVLRGFELLHKDAKTVFDIGGENSYFYSFENSGEKLVLNDFSSNSICGAGGGALIEKMSRRLEYSSLEDFVNGAISSDSNAKIAGRCGVFAESDVVHHSNKGTPVNSIASGLCNMLARNFTNNVLRGKEIYSPVYMIGGVSNNKAVVKFIEGFIEKKIIVPEENEYLKAYGACMDSPKKINTEEAVLKLRNYNPENKVSFSKPLCLEKSVTNHSPTIILDKTAGEEVELSLNEDYEFKDRIYFLGLDVGSVSTKAAIIDLAGNFAFGIYRRTKGKPIDAVKDLMKRIEEYKPGMIIGGVGVTGSGRDVVGEIIGKDVVKNEITAQARGASFFFPEIDSVFEIGGQDSKYIRMNKGKVISPVMNKACAASTGSFLEEQARVLNINIKKEFSETALKSKHPCSLAEKCAILMTTSLTHYNSSSVEDKSAGLAYAVVDNYLHRVVEKNPIGDNIVFQGAVAFNNAIVSAFETRLGKKIHVPKYPHLTGAIGIASITKQKYEEGGIKKTRFRGFDKLSKLEYETKIVQCEKDCGNSCEIVRITTPDGELYYGDICERYSGAHEKGKHKSNLFMEREKILMSYHRGHKPGMEKIGVARTGTFNELAPFWFSFFDSLNYEVVLSKKTDKATIRKGIENATAEQFCFPVKVAFGHYKNLQEMLENKEIDYLFSPDIIESHATRFKKGFTGWERNYTCPYLQNFSSLMTDKNEKIIESHIFLEKKNLVNLLYDSFKGKRTKKEIRRAVNAGNESYFEFKEKLRDVGKRFLAEIENSDKPGIVLVGRPYATFDEAMNLRIGKKINDCGFRVLPQDMLPLPENDMSEKWTNEFSVQGQSILQAANVIKNNKKLEAIFLDYFACGPNSFIRGFFQEELEKPFLTIQIDEHSADAGVITRLEAFLDSLEVSLNQRL